MGVVFPLHFSWELTLEKIIANSIRYIHRFIFDEFNQNYFFNRPEEKNALAISSNQSKLIDSYSQVKENYNRSLESDDLKKCPEHWGGYSFIPYYFEFWEGHELRLNKREVFDKIDGIWKHSFLQP